MTRDDIVRKLDELAEAEAQKALLADDKQHAIEVAMPADVVKLLADIDAEFDMQARAVDANIEELETEIKAATSCCTESVKGAHKIAVLTPPKPQAEHPSDVAAYATDHPAVATYVKRTVTVEVDAEGLLRYAKTTDAEAARFITYTKPKVSIRDTKG